MTLVASRSNVQPSFPRQFFACPIERAFLKKFGKKFRKIQGEEMNLLSRALLIECQMFIA